MGESTVAMSSLKVCRFRQDFEQSPCVLLCASKNKRKAKGSMFVGQLCRVLEIECTEPLHATRNTYLTS